MYAKSYSHTPYSHTPKVCVQFGDDRKKAERITRKNMKNQPYWKDKNLVVLEGETATDEEFAEVMKKM